MQTIVDVTTAELPGLVAGLIKEGLAFKVTHDYTSDGWIITFNGGF